MPTLDAIHWGPASKAKPKQLVVLCHGLGADAFDLIDLAPSLGACLPGRDLRFGPCAFPA